jgi:hypothetical protein
MPSEAAAPSAAAGVLRPGWLGQLPGVGALMSTRAGGVSPAPWDSLNLGRGSGDDDARVGTNRARFTALLEGARPVWLRQVHGVRVRRLTTADLAPDAPDPPADAAWTTEPGIACTAMAADCLPVLFAADDGSAVAAAHAGWRGLAGGVLEATVAALEEGAGIAPPRLQAWLGACIGPAAFEVGADVLQSFGAVAASEAPARCDHCTAAGVRFVWSPRPDGAPRWRADLAALARERLRALGVVHIQASGRCTVAEPSAFFSFRRDGVTGRMAAAIWRRPGG